MTAPRLIALKLFLGSVILDIFNLNIPFLNHFLAWVCLPAASASETSSGSESTDNDDPFDLELALERDEFLGYLTAFVFPEH